jgi:DNA-binding transcriptional ArsR family regulator
MLPGCPAQQHYANMRAHDELAGARRWPEQHGSDTVAVAAEVLGHLADPTRLVLLELLADGPQDVSTLVGQVDASRSSVSQHLARLRLARLVAARRDGRRMIYGLTSDHVRQLVAEALTFARHLEGRGGTQLASDESS